MLSNTLNVEYSVRTRCMLRILISYPHNGTVRPMIATYAGNLQAKSCYVPVESNQVNCKLKMVRVVVVFYTKKMRILIVLYGRLGDFNDNVIRRKIRYG